MRAEKPGLLSQKMLEMYSKPGLQMALLLLNDGTMSQVPDVYSAICNLQSAFPSLDSPNKSAQGRMGAVVLTSLRKVKQLVQGHTARRQHYQAKTLRHLTPSPDLFPCSRPF